MSPNPTRVYRLVTVTPRLISAMMPSDEALLDENSVALMGIAFPPRNCHPAHHRVHAQHKKSFRIRCKKLGAALMEHAPRGTGTPVFDRKSTTSSALLAASRRPGMTMERSHAVGAAGGPAAFRSWETAVTSCAGANGFASMMLLGTPFDAHSSACAPLM